MSPQRIVRPNTGRIYGVGIGGISPPPAPQPRPRRSPETIRWLDDQRYRGRTSKIILDSKLLVLGVRPRRG